MPLVPNTLSVERVVAAPPERIFDLLADPARHQELDGSGTVRDPHRAPERLSLGARFGMEMKAAVGYRMVNEVVEFEEGRRIAWQPRPAAGALRPFVGGRIWRYELEPVEGGTLVRETWDISQEKVPPLLWALRPLTRIGMTRTLDRLEELVT
ncbi:MAG: SRPBCC family protein [Actinomycetes bacterium]